MRITVKVDSATEPELRGLLSAYYGATGRDDVRVGLNGPECYNAESPPLKGREAWRFVDALSEGTLLDKVAEEVLG